MRSRSVLLQRIVPAGLVGALAAVGLVWVALSVTDAGPGGSDDTATQPVPADPGRTATGSEDAPADPDASVEHDDPADVPAARLVSEPAEVRLRTDGPVVEQLPSAAVGLAARPGRNELDQPVLLDETALLACAHNDYAAVLLAQGELGAARDEIARAAARVQVSAVGVMTVQWATLLDSLGGGDPRATVGGFSDLCRANGYRR